MITRITPMTDDTIQIVLARLKEMLGKEPPKAGPSFKGQIQNMASEIRQLIKKGFKYGDIVAVINDAAGVDMKARTLRNYVPRGKKRAPAKSAEQGEQTKPAAAAQKPLAEKAPEKPKKATDAGPERPAETTAQAGKEAKTPFPKAPVSGPRGFQIRPDQALK